MNNDQPCYYFIPNCPSDFEIQWVLALCAFWDSGKVAYPEIAVSETDTTGHKLTNARTGIEPNATALNMKFSLKEAPI